jgi:hypothetical protein
LLKGKEMTDNNIIYLIKLDEEYDNEWIENGLFEEFEEV